MNWEAAAHNSQAGTRDTFNTFNLMSCFLIANQILTQPYYKTIYFTNFTYNTICILHTYIHTTFTVYYIYAAIWWSVFDLVLRWIISVFHPGIIFHNIEHNMDLHIYTIKPYWSGDHLNDKMLHFIRVTIQTLFTFTCRAPLLLKNVLWDEKKKMILTSCSYSSSSSR